MNDVKKKYEVDEIQKKNSLYKKFIKYGTLSSVYCHYVLLKYWN